MGNNTTISMGGKAVTITVTRSAGEDNAVLVMIDTAGFQPNGADGGPGLRVLVNDADISECGPDDYMPYGESGDDERAAADVQITVPLVALPYL